MLQIYSVYLNKFNCILLYLNFILRLYIKYQKYLNSFKLQMLTVIIRKKCMSNNTTKIFEPNENVQVKDKKFLKNNSVIHTYSFMSLDGELHAGRNAAGLLNLSSVHAVPMARTTKPDSPSRSKHCKYPTTAFPLISSTFKPIFLCSSPIKKEGNSFCFISPHYIK